MSEARRIAFLIRQRCGYAQRLLRGVFRYADEHGPCVIREFVVPWSLVGKTAFTASLANLLDWSPDGIITGLMDDDLRALRRVVGDELPLVNLYASTPGPRLGVVTGSHRQVVTAVIRHLRDIGIRSPGFLVLETGAVESRLADSISAVLPSFVASRDLLVHPVDMRTVEDPDASVLPIPQAIVSWLNARARPLGVLSLGLGGGDYLLRVCRELNLRVPEDVAVVGMDDADVCLRSVPSLTSVTPVGEQVGFAGMQLLDDLLRNGGSPPEPLRVPAVELVARHSTARRALRCDIPTAIRFIDENACRGIAIAEVLALMPQGSRMTFYQEFQRVAGIAPGEYIRSVQIGEAKRLLANTHLEVVQIAQRCGFSSGSAFARVFRSVAGTTPSAFREGVLPSTADATSQSSATTGQLEPQRRRGKTRAAEKNR
jgi:LacI family transcriptional regulator